MTGVLKKGLGLVLVLFLLWFLFNNPQGLGTLSKEIGTWLWSMLTQLFTALTSFLTALFSK